MAWSFSAIGLHLAEVYLRAGGEGVGSQGLGVAPVDRTLASGLERAVKCRRGIEGRSFDLTTVADAIALSEEQVFEDCLRLVLRVDPRGFIARELYLEGDRRVQLAKLHPTL